MSALMLSTGIAVWFAAGAALSHLARRRMGYGIEEYFLANRRLGGFISAMTYSATTYSAFMMVGLVGLTYASGVGSLGFELTYLMGTVILLVLFAPRYWVAGRLFGCVTPAELLRVRYQNKWVGGVTALLCLAMLIPYASVQLMGVGYLVETLSGGAISYMAGTVIAASITVVYSWWAGLRSVAWTDALQACIMFIASCILLLFVWLRFFPGSAFVFENVRPEMLRVSWSFPMFLGLTLPWAFFALTNPQVAQRMYVPKNVQSLRRMILGFAVFGFVYTVICVILGLAAAVVVPGLKVADNAMPELLRRVPPLLALVVFLSITAAAVSTLNSIILTLSSMFGRDIIKAFEPTMSESRELFWGKLFIPILTIACLMFAQLKLGLIAVMSAMASGGLLLQLPAIVGCFFWKRATAAGAIWSMAVGGVLVGSMYVLNLKPLGHWPAIWGLLICTAIFILVSLAISPPKDTASFMEKVSEGLKAHFWG